MEVPEPLERELTSRWGDILSIISIVQIFAYISLKVLLSVGVGCIGWWAEVVTIMTELFFILISSI